MTLNKENLKHVVFRIELCVAIEIEEVARNTLKRPCGYFGAGNIFRVFRGTAAASVELVRTIPDHSHEAFDEEIRTRHIGRIDNLSLLLPSAREILKGSRPQ